VANECYVPVVFARKDITDDFLAIDTDCHTITYVVPEYIYHVKEGIRGMSHAGLQNPAQSKLSGKTLHFIFGLMGNAGIIHYINLHQHCKYAGSRRRLALCYKYAHHRSCP